MISVFAKPRSQGMLCQSWRATRRSCSSRVALSWAMSQRHTSPVPWIPCRTIRAWGSQGDFSMAEYVVHVISIDTRPGKQPHNYGKIQNPPFSSWVNPLFLWQFTKGSVSYLSSPCFSTIIGGIGGPARGKRRILDVMFRYQL